MKTEIQQLKQNAMMEEAIASAEISMNTQEKERYKEQIKFCPKCVSMTKTINYRCGKCKQTRRIYKNSKATR